MPPSHCHKKPRSVTPNQSDHRNTASRDPRHNCSGSNAIITDKHDRSVSDAMITDTTAKESPIVVTPNVNSDNRQYYDSHQYTNINDNNTVEAGNKTELLCMQLTLLLKVLESNNNRKATQNLLQYFWVQSQQSNWHVAFLLWYSSKKGFLYGTNWAVRKRIPGFSIPANIFSQSETETTPKTATGVYLHLSPPLWFSHPDAKGYELLAWKRRPQAIQNPPPIWKDNGDGVVRVFHMENG